MSGPEPIVLLSALEHHMYCPRQCALIHVDGIWSENAHTVGGSRYHRRVDTAPSRIERGRQVLRAFPLYSEKFGLSGRADAVEVQEDGTLVPVEYKSGGHHGVSAEVQMCAQALCLEEMTGGRLEYGYVWYAGPRRKMRVVLTTELREKTIASIEEVRGYLVSGILPKAVADQRCRECQLESHCLPDVLVGVDRVLSYVRDEVFRCG